MNKDILPVLDEISAVLKKHDMAGLVMVSNANHCDWRMEIEASWSCAWLEKDASGFTVLRVRSKLKDYRNKETQKQTLEATVGTFVTFLDSLNILKERVSNILMMISKQVDFLGKSTREDG